MAIKKVKAAGVKKAEPQIKDYWPHYHRAAILLVILMSIITTLVIGLSLIIANIVPNTLAFWITMIATLATTTLLMLLTVDSLLVPLRDLSMAITSAAGEQPSEALANPNAPRYAKNGFRPLLQFIYDRASEAIVSNAHSETPVAPQLTTALQQTSTGIVIMNAAGAILFANRTAPTAVDMNDTQQLTLLFESDDTLTSWLATCRETAVHAQKTWLRIPNAPIGDENRRIFNVTANYEKGSAAEVVLVAYDATDVYQPEDDDLDFISFAAHELRGPITVIRGYLDVLDDELQTKLAPDQKELFNRLIVSANRLTGYVNNILNTSKYDRRHLQIHLSEESLASIYDLIRDDMELRAASQHRLLAIDIPVDLPTIAADRSSLSEVLSNLIDNALKYSNEGGAISVSAALDGEFVKVLVSDNGIGIPSSVVGNLFHKFYRSHRSRETVAGTGIGLYLCKAIVESHGGQISVSSIEGQGSTFSFTIPTYASVANTLQANDFTNAGLISSGNGWIKNHSKFTS